jgi:hypothetical protein
MGEKEKKEMDVDRLDSKADLQVSILTRSMRITF